MSKYRRRDSPEYCAGLYIRLSKEDGDKEESDSVSNQKKLLEEFLEGKAEIGLKDFYIDDGYTGTNFERPGFRRMLNDIMEGKINCVIVKDLSRFGRDYIDTGFYLERFFPEKNVRFISLIDGIDSEKQSYDMLLPIKNIFNEQYARDISRKIYATILAKQKAGDFVGAFACYGYRKHPKEKNRLSIDEEAAAVVRRIFTLFVQGISKRQIAELLNQEGIPCPSEYKRLCGENYRNAHGAEKMRWTYSTVHQMLGNEIYTGNMVQGKKHQKMHGRQQMMPRDKWIRAKGTHEPVIEPELWEKSQRLLRQRRKEVCRVYEQPILSGLLKCGDCKKNMILNRWKRADGSMAAVYYCGTYKRRGKTECTPHALPAEAAENMVKDDLKKILDSACLYKNEIEKMFVERRETDRAGREILKTENKLILLKKRRQSLYEDYQDGVLSRDEFISYRSDYLNKEKSLVGYLKSCRAEQHSEEKKQGMDIQEILRSLKGENPEIADRNTVLEMIDRIEVYESGYLEIYYRFKENPDISFGGRYLAERESGKQ
ncbi:MAG TPA: recombinase family protein [Candidatus Blautia excrementipullorum]|nr:recombinase family protein [Candidatus Blautia excrementipullorum]